MQIKLIAKSSSGLGTYEVDFDFDIEGLVVSCNCEAGRFGKTCKHKIDFLLGQGDALANEAQLVDLERVKKLLDNTDFPNLLTQLAKSEAEFETAKRNLSRIKKLIEKKMKSNA